MGLTKNVTKRLEVPGEDGAWISIRMLSWITLDKAKKIRTGELIETARSLSGVELPTPTVAAEKDRLVQYDMGTLLKHGIVSWGYGDEVDIEQLDAPTADWAARAILDYALPGPAESKGLASPSTAT